MPSIKTTIGEICEVIAGQSPPSETYNTDGNGLPFFQGKADFGYLYPDKIRVWCNVPQKIAEEGDILISVRAPVGPTNICNQRACIGRGLSAIRAGAGVDKKYLLYFLRKYEPKLASQGKGTTFSSITQKDIKKIPISIPSLEDQKNIVSILDQIEAISHNRKESMRLLDQYVESAFIDMFGDPVTNPKSWKKVRFGELGKLDRGKSKHRPRGAAELLGGDHPLIQTGDVARAGTFITDYKSTYSDLGLKQSRKWPAGTLCITIAANIADTGILTFDACFPDSVVGFVPDKSKTNNLFILFWLSFLKEMIEKNAPQVAQKNINLRILRDLEVIEPPVDMQNRFADLVLKVDETKKKMIAQQKEVESYFGALSQKAFAGAL